MRKGSRENREKGESPGVIVASGIFQGGNCACLLRRSWRRSIS
jgi:hypothetical protein